MTTPMTPSQPVAAEWPFPPAAPERHRAAGDPAAALRAAAAPGLRAGWPLAQVAAGLACREGELVAAHAGLFDAGESPLKARRLRPGAATWLAAARALPQPPAVETEAPGLLLRAAIGGLVIEPGRVTQAFAVERLGPDGSVERRLLGFDAAAGCRLVLCPAPETTASYQALVAWAASPRLDAGWNAPLLPPPPTCAPAGRRLPDGAVWELLVRAVQVGLPLRLEAGGTLRRDGALDRLVFDGPRLHAIAGDARLQIDESRCGAAWCCTELGRSGLRHVIEIADADGRGWLRLADATQAPRTESCTWREWVHALLPAAAAAC